ncbi:hypothetical protein [Telmatospirillum siberiense]|uniref:DUF4892 domain-containing protein n=1 Tax=Telmatospirillum siberiense TaxID=382514 RepID=A0A2N3PNE5_9PROT|nr:hypothetical protein [Telmatospirillum siberiense]PKU21917.1 hypothetical protein CWS72_24330 [Telmatospirillum siberiense]
MRTSGLVLGLLFLLAAPAFAEEAPFGLRWGATFEELQTRGFSGAFQQDDGQVKIYQSNKLLNAPSFSDFARVGVDRQYGLQRIMWVSKEITDDPTGEKGLALYRTLKQTLTEKYGEPKTSEEEMGGSRTYSGTAFYQCLAEDGCGVFVTVWRSLNSDARLRLLGTSSGKGRLEIVYLGPDWDDVVAASKKKPKP